MIIGGILFLLFFGALPWVLFSYLPVWGAVSINLVVSMFLLSTVHAAGKNKPSSRSTRSTRSTLSTDELIALLKK